MKAVVLTRRHFVLALLLVALIFPLARSTATAVTPTPTLSWVVGADGIGNGASNVIDLVVDSAGNSYTTGWFVETVDFAANGIGGANSFGDVVSAGNADIYLAKHNPSGALAWVKRIGGTAADLAVGLAVDTNDEIVMTGSFNGTVDFAGDGAGGAGDLTSLAYGDIFAAKFSGSGTMVWAVRAGGMNSDGGWDGQVATDALNNVYLHVGFQWTADFAGNGMGGADDLVSLGNYDVAIVKLNSSGNYQWGVRSGGVSTEWPKEISIDSSGNILVTGISNSTVNDFAADGIGGAGDVAMRGAYDTYLAQYTSAGTLVWAKSIGGTLADTGADISVVENDNIVIAAGFNGTIDPAGNGLGGANGSDDLTSSGVQDILIAKYSSSGAMMWAKKIGSTGDDYPVDGDIDSSGNYYITGAFNQTVDFAGDGIGGVGDLVSAGLKDVFVAKFNPTGDFEWAMRGGGTLVDGGFLGGIDAAPNGSTVHIGDFYTGSVDFAGDGIGGANTSGDLVATGTKTYPFVAKYSVPVALLAQTVTWLPNSSLSQSDSPFTPNISASSNGNGAITYSVVSSGTTSCSVASLTGVVTFANAGTCIVRATADSTSTFLLGTVDVSFNIATTPVAVTTTVPSTTTAPATPSPSTTTSSVTTPMSVLALSDNPSLPAKKAGTVATSTTGAPSSPSSTSVLDSAESVVVESAPTQTTISSTSQSPLPMKNSAPLDSTRSAVLESPVLDGSQDNGSNFLRTLLIAFAGAALIGGLLVSKTLRKRLHRSSR